MPYFVFKNTHLYYHCTHTDNKQMLTKIINKLAATHQSFSDY